MDELHQQPSNQAARAEMRGIPEVVGAGDETNILDDFSRPNFPEVSSLIVAAGHHVWLTLCLVAIIAGGVGCLVWEMIPPNYLAMSFVNVRQSADVSLLGSAGRNDDAAFIRSQQAKVTSPQVIQRALQDKEVKAILHRLPKQNRADWLIRQVEVEIGGGSEVMSISMMYDDPDIGARLVNAITDSYLFEVTTSETERRQRRRIELERLAAEADERLSTRWQELQRLASSLGTGSPQTLSLRDQIQLQSYREYAQRLRSIQLEKNQLKVQQAEARVREETDFTISDAELQLALDSHPSVVLQQERLEDVEERMREMADIVQSPDSPRIAQLRADRDYYQQRLEQLATELRPLMKNEVEERFKSQAEATRVEIDRKLTVIAQEEEFLNGMLGQLEEGLDTESGTQGVELEILRHEIEREESVADSLWRSLEQLKMEEQAQARVSLMNRAELPKHPIRSRQLKAAAVAGTVTCFAIVFVVGFMEWRTCRVRHPRDLLANLRIRLFGIGSYAVGLPLSWRWRNARRDPLTSGVSEVAAQLIGGVPMGSGLPGVLVTSAVHSEPRHFVAIELASALCRTGRRVLLVDAEPGVSLLVKSLGAEFQSVLLGTQARQTDPIDWIRPTSQLNLDFAHVGGEDREKSLASTRLLGRLLERVEGNYDAIVVHGPAILTQPESVLLATRLSQTVLAMVVGKSRWNLIAAARQRLTSVGNRVLGVVMHVQEGTSQLAILPGKAVQRQEPSDGPDDKDLEALLAAEIESMRQDARVGHERPQQEESGGEVRSDKTKS